MELDNVFNILEIATRLEKDGKRIEAATKYCEGCYLMRQVIARMPESESSSITCSLLQEKIQLYTKIAQNLYFRTTPTNEAFSVDGESHEINLDSPLTMVIPTRSQLSSPEQDPSISISPRFTQSGEINRKASAANVTLSQAIDQEENNMKEDAIKSYINAAEMYLAAIRLAENSSSSSSAQILPVLQNRVGATLDRVETLKNPKKTRDIHHYSDTGAQFSSLSDEEISVLKGSSLIASGLFLPFSHEEAECLSREVHSKMKVKPWSDPDGFLRLSDKQKKRFVKFMRPSEIIRQRSRTGMKQHTPVMVSDISPYTIRQQYVTDCSFIASLCICALFEKRFRKRLITSIIYPQDKNGIPIYNPGGKYIVKMWLNGVARAVIVDDFLPVDKHSNLLCSQTTGNRENLELFCSIIEKAYMKLCGGYDFPGSNSGIDLFSLTGWIPERIFFPSHTSKELKDFETPIDRAWDRLFSANSFGDCLITVSTTRDLTEEAAEFLGLVTGHAYAVLNVFESQNGIKLLKLKNPWSCRGWLGKYSPNDNIWRDNLLRKELRYDPEEASKRNDGIFWIRWDDVLLYFRNIQLSWNPKLFSYRMTTHGLWPKVQGPKNDTFNVGENPQYIIAFSRNGVLKKPTIWVMLSRHVTKQEQEGAEVKDFLTVHLVRNSAELKRLWVYPNGKGTIVQGCYTNNPHVLVRYDVSEPDDQYISLILSQHEKTQNISYTLSCYSTQSFTLGRPKMLPFSIDSTGEWTDETAGGAIGSKNFFTNPMFALILTEKTKLQLRCSISSQTIPINVILLENDPKDFKAKTIKKCPILDSGNYRHGFAITETKSISVGTYFVICSTYHSGQMSKFTLTVDSSVETKVFPINC